MLQRISAGKLSKEVFSNIGCGYWGKVVLIRREEIRSEIILLQASFKRAPQVQSRVHDGYAQSAICPNRSRGSLVAQEKSSLSELWYG